MSAFQGSPGTDTGMRRADVALVSMPFGPLFLPSIGLGLLKSSISRRGIAVSDFYFTFRLAERIGAHLYLDISNGFHSTFDLLGEWFFSRSLFGPNPETEKRYIQDVLEARSPAHKKNGWYGAPFRQLTPEMVEQLVELRNQDEFLEDCVDSVLKTGPAVVGFTSVFQQQIASLAAAKILKSRAPDIAVVMGGANCEGAMGIEVLRQFPFVDCVVSGEADLVFPEIVEVLLARQPVPALPGVHTRESLRRNLVYGKAPSAPPVEHMDTLPVPDYDGYFRQFEESRPRLSDVYTPHILFETSRGCYWGKVAHCTFCGLNGANMAFRSKSAGRALEELEQLAARYPGCPVTVVDNILDMQYFQSFVPELAARKLDLNLFYEVKSNLKKEQVRLLAAAGIRAIQPGIESLSTSILAEMKKGCTALQNIQLLKWCKEAGVRAIWNILWGFPREDAREYERMAEMIPSLHHLEPPQVASSLRLDRFSPYFEKPEEFGFRDARPYPAYSYVYGLPDQALRNLAYYYTFEYEQPRNPSEYTAGLVEAVRAWRDRKAESDLFLIDLGPALLICDFRVCAAEPFHLVTDASRSLYLACDAIRGAAALERAAGATIARDQIHEILDPLVRRRLMLREGDSYLSLAVDLSEYHPPRNIRLRFAEAVRRYGRESGGEFEIENIGRSLAETRAAATPLPFALSAGHVRIAGDGRVLVDLDALERMDLQALGSRLWR